MRQKLALIHGASSVFDPSVANVVAETFKATNSIGADVVFDCAGVQSAFDTALGAVRARGNVVVVAIWEHQPKVNMNAILFKEITFTGETGQLQSIWSSSPLYYPTLLNRSNRL